MPRPSRRTVLATGSTLAGAALAGGLPAQATAATPVATSATAASAPSEDAWRTVLDDADLVWQKMPKTWYEGPYLGNGLLGSGIYQEPGKNAIRFNVQHSEVQDHRPEFGSCSVWRGCPSATSRSNPSAPSPASTGACACVTRS